VRIYRQALKLVVSAEAKAYGVTVTLWGCGSLCLAAAGTPRVRDVFLFAAGVILAQVSWAAASFHGIHDTFDAEQPTQTVWGAVHVVAPLAGLGVAWGIAELVDSEVVWFLTPLCGLTVFQLLLALETQLATVSRPDLQRAASGQTRD